ncbi:MAG: NADP-dependent malic enzyme [Bacteroidetes bacterium]|nr:MAG: NADP-dependent malic enzyme [Bacteroidota bacterium]
MDKKKVREQDALDYHSDGKPGKIEVIPTKSTKSQRDLALAYSPGVALPCLKIAENVEDVYKYTAKGNLVAVISNGTAVLGLGDIGAEASKPVMEGKGILFKIFAGIDVFDLELNTKNIDEFVQVVKALEPTFGGINLEDIKAPDCFEIEDRLKAELKIPIMHDDQHGTAIIASAGLLNALEIIGKKIENIQIVVSGAGAAAFSCVRLFMSLGATRENIILVDSKGVVREDRSDLTPQKRQFSTKRDLKTLDDAIKNTDFFLGLSKADVLLPAMLLTMAEKAIVFALANPDPEIDYNLAVATRPDIIMATGRSDFPNQVNNVLGFPFIFRGALDVRATCINEEMKLAAVRAIANLAKTPVPEIVNVAYNQKNIIFGEKYIIPKPLDPRLLTTVAPAVAKAAMESGVAKKHITDWDNYEKELIQRMGQDNTIMRNLANRAKISPQRVVFADAEEYKVLKAAQILLEEKIAIPILLGRKKVIEKIREEYGLELEGVQIIDPRSEDVAETRQKYADLFFKKVQRKGYNLYETQNNIFTRNYFGLMMLENGDADAMVSGLTRQYSDLLRPAIDIIGVEKENSKISAMQMMLTKDGPLFLADTIVITKPDTDDLVEIAINVAKMVQKFNIEPRIAMLSYSNFGSSKDAEPRMVREAVEKIKEKYPNLVVDGEIQPSLAFNTETLAQNYSFSDLVTGKPNILIFPTLSAGNIAYKLLQSVGGIDTVGPILLGLKKSFHLLQLGSTVREIVNITTIACVDAIEKRKI